MLHKLTHQSKINRWNYAKTGLLMMALAACFIYDRSYFFYPPSLAPMWNNLYFDMIGMLAGLTMFVYGVFDLKIDRGATIGLAVSVGFLTVLVVAELFHVWGAGYFRLHPTIVLELYTIINLMQLAYESEPVKQWGTETKKERS